MVFGLVLLSEEIIGGGAHDLFGHTSITQPCWISAANDRDRDVGGLTHHELGGGSEFINDSDFSDMHLASEGIGGATKVDDSGDACTADRYVGNSAAPCAAKGVGNDDRNFDTESVA
jgi:hypothetical protein